MTIQELIYQLQAVVEGGDCTPDTEVRLAFQPNWPLQYHIGSVVVPDPADMSELDVYHLDSDEEEDMGWYISHPDEGDIAGAFPTRELAFKHLDERAAAEREDNPPIAYISEGGQIYDAPYLPGYVSRELGWR